MSLLKKLFSNESKGLLDSIGTTIDKVVTSDQERSKLKNELSSIVINGLTKVTEQQKEVLVTEMQGNFLQRSWRPILMLAFGGIIVSVFFILPLVNIFMENPDIQQFITDFGQMDNFWGLLKIGMGGYVVGRSVEKVSDTVTRNVDLPFLKKKDREIK